MTENTTASGAADIERVLHDFEQKQFGTPLAHIAAALRAELRAALAASAPVAPAPQPAPMPYPTDAQIEAVYEQTMGQHLRIQAAPAAGAVAGSDDLSGTLRRLDSKELAAWVDRGMALSENLAMYVQADCTLRESQARDMLRAHLFSAQPAPAAPTSPAKAAESVLEDAARLEINHLRGVTKMVAPAQPVAYLPREDAQRIYDSQDDIGYVDDLTNNADAKVIPLYAAQPSAAAAAKAPAAPTGWYALAADGMATRCVDRDDAEKEAANSEKKWPHLGPHRAVQLYTAPPAPTEQWMPIETAPQDGTRVILAEAEKVFHGGFVGVQFKEHRDADGNYLDQTDADAYWLNFEDGDVCHPTHWQPEPALPAPPQGAAKGANDAASS